MILIKNFQELFLYLKQSCIFDIFLNIRNKFLFKFSYLFNHFINSLSNKLFNILSIKYFRLNYLFDITNISFKTSFMLWSTFAFWLSTNKYIFRFTTLVGTYWYSILISNTFYIYLFWSVDVIYIRCFKETRRRIWEHWICYKNR